MFSSEIPQFSHSPGFPTAQESVLRDRADRRSAFDLIFSGFRFSSVYYIRHSKAVYRCSGLFFQLRGKFFNLRGYAAEQHDDRVFSFSEGITLRIAFSSGILKFIPAA